jgi:hypothetical protein
MFNAVLKFNSLYFHFIVGFVYYSFVNYVGDKKLAIQPMMSTINFLKDGLDFKIPVFLIQGEDDILTPKEITEVFYGKIIAPSKNFI